MSTTNGRRPRVSPAVGEPMAARDALNYYFETDRTAASIVHAYIVDADRSDRSVRTLDDAVAFARGLLDLHPLFHRRLQTVPAHLAFPVWVDCDVVLTDHVFVHHATGANDTELVRELIVRTSCEPPGRDAPAWQLHWVVGLRGVPGVPDGGTVLVFRVHHSAIDGMGLTDLAHRILAPDNADVTGFRADQYRRPSAPIPTIPSALRALPGSAARFVRAVRARRRAERRLAAETDTSAVRTFPATRFNRNVPPDMTFAHVFLDLEKVRRVKTSVTGATVNDVLLTMVSLALSDYLDQDAPDETLGASFPMNVRSVSSTDDTANQLAIAVVDLFTTEPDPLTRLAAISAAARDRKLAVTRRVRELPPHPFTCAPAFSLRLLSAVMPRRPADPKRVAVNTMVTNIPYGPAAMELLGAPVTGVYAPLMTAEGVNLAHAALTTGNRVSLSATSQRGLMPDVDRYVACLSRALDQLERARLDLPADAEQF